MKLYEVDIALRKLCARFEEHMEAGLEAPFEIKEELDALILERDQKLGAIGRMIKNDQAYIDVVDAEVKRLQQRKKQLTNRQDSLKNYVAQFGLNAGEKWSDGIVEYGWRKSEQVSCPENPSALRKMWRRIKEEVNKEAIKNALKAGKKIKGCSLVQKQNLQVK
jgi:hypothetical protein